MSLIHAPGFPRPQPCRDVQVAVGLLIPAMAADLKALLADPAGWAAAHPDVNGTRLNQQQVRGLTAAVTAFQTPAKAGASRP